MRGPPYPAGNAPPVTTLTLSSAPQATRFSITLWLSQARPEHRIARKPAGNGSNNSRDVVANFETGGGAGSARDDWPSGRGLKRWPASGRLAVYPPVVVRRQSYGCAKGRQRVRE